MTQRTCDGCGKRFPVKEMFGVEDRVLCAACLVATADAEKQHPEVLGVPLADPTVCAACGRDNGETPLQTLAGKPVCETCAHFFRAYPFPRWIKVAAAALLVLVVGALIGNARFFQAYREITSAARTLEAGDLSRATTHFRSAATLVPEKAELEGYASYWEGVLLLNQDKPAEALDRLKLCRGVLPQYARKELRLEETILYAAAGKCFDERDYDGFLKAAQRLREYSPRGVTSLLLLASAQACVYASTGDGAFRDQALAALDRARKDGERLPGFESYENRIRHRLETREIISRKEFERRFPDGWRPARGPDR